MLQALKYKFNSLTFKCICALQEKLWKLALAPHQDLDDFVNELCDIFTMLNEANPPQGYSELQLVNMVLHQLQASHYSDQIKAIMTAYHMDSSAITSLESIIQTLCIHDIFEGKEYWGTPVGIASLTAPKIRYRPGNNYVKQVYQGALLSVSDMISDLQLHPKYPWAGQGNLSSDQIKVHCTLWSCVVCHTHEHPLQNCPFFGKL